MRWRASALLVWSATILLAAIVFALYLPRAAPSALMDFKAFYCAATVVREHADPYLTEPLRSCERHASTLHLFRILGDQVIPAPLPGYALAAFMPLTYLPYDFAAVLWDLLNLALLVAGITRLRLLTGDRVSTLVAAFALSAGLVSLSLGQFAAGLLGVLALAAFALERGRPLAAALWASAALLEPHIGLPTCLALALWAPRTRIPLLIVGAILAGTSVAVMGLTGIHEYVSQVLPDAARANARDVAQYSLTGLLATLGVNTNLAITLGGASSVIMLILGSTLAGPLARSTGRKALIVLLPAAFSVFGGPYIHLSQMAIALPLAFFLRAQTPQSASILTLAIIALAVPWLEAVSTLSLIPLIIVIAFVIARSRFSLGTALISALVAAIIPLMLTAHLPALAPFGPLSVPNPRMPAEEAWGTLIQARMHVHTPTWWTLAFRLLTWLGLGSVIAVACARAAPTLHAPRLLPTIRSRLPPSEDP